MIILSASTCISMVNGFVEIMKSWPKSISKILKSPSAYHENERTVKYKPKNSQSRLLGKYDGFVKSPFAALPPCKAEDMLKMREAREET